MIENFVIDTIIIIINCFERTQLGVLLYRVMPLLVALFIIYASLLSSLLSGDKGIPVLRGLFVCSLFFLDI